MQSGLGKRNVAFRESEFHVVNGLVRSVMQLNCARHSMPQITSRRSLGGGGRIERVGEANKGNAFV